MSYVSDAKFQSSLKKIKRDNLSKKRKQLLREERNKYSWKMKLPPTSKIALWAGFLLFAEIIVFCQYIAIRSYDTAPLVAMIGAIGGWISIFHSYSKKSSIENSKNGIVYESAMIANQQKSNENEDVVAMG